MFLIPFGDHKWAGESGRRYRFKVTLTDKGIPAKGGGIYVFVRRRFFFFLTPLYIGKAVNLSSRHKDHERWAEAWWDKGATERHFMVVTHENDRVRIEEDLIRRYKPKLNNIHIPRSINDAPNHVDLRGTWKLRKLFPWAQ